MGTSVLGICQLHRGSDLLGCTAAPDVPGRAVSGVAPDDLPRTLAPALVRDAGGRNMVGEKACESWLERRISNHPSSAGPNNTVFHFG